MIFHLYLKRIRKQKGTRLKFDLYKLRDPEVAKPKKTGFDSSAQTF